LWRGDDSSRALCPTNTNPFHHFVVNATPIVHDTGAETYSFVCTACRSTAHIHYRIPRLSPGYHDLLTDPVRLKNRFLEAQKEDNSRAGLEQQPGIKVLEALSTYIADALSGTKTHTAIPLHNKRFMASFGTDCDPLLHWLGFRKQKTDAGHEEWKIPEPPAATPLASDSSPRFMLEDIMEELYARIRKYSAPQLVTIRNRPPTATPYHDAVNELLGIEGYPKALYALRKREPDDDDPYAGLGAVHDFTNDLLLYSFRRQVDWDPKSSSYYYDCFSMIAGKRQDDDLNIKTATLASQGYVSRADVAAAYRYLGLQDSAESATDDQILGTFEARLENSPRNQESELRDKLRIIGVARDSALLSNAAENGESTHFFSKPSSVVSPKRKTSSLASHSPPLSPKRLKVGEDPLLAPDAPILATADTPLFAIPDAQPDEARNDTVPAMNQFELAMLDLGRLERARVERAQLQLTRLQLAGFTNPYSTFCRDSELSRRSKAEADAKRELERQARVEQLCKEIDLDVAAQEGTIWSHGIAI
jgi:hypothetical protein